MSTGFFFLAMTAIFCRLCFVGFVLLCWRSFVSLSPQPCCKKKRKEGKEGIAV